MFQTYADNDSECLKIREIELTKAGLHEFKNAGQFAFKNWSFMRCSSYWEVKTHPDFGFTKIEGMYLYNYPFPIHIFDNITGPSNLGNYIRLAGHGGTVSPEYENGLWLEEGKCTKYHIDNQFALNFFVNFIRFHKIQDSSDVKKHVLDERDNGNILTVSFDGIHIQPLTQLMNQPIDGILYDLNRDELTILTFVNDPKWMNDFAAVQVLKEFAYRSEKHHQIIKDCIERFEKLSKQFDEESKTDLVYKEYNTGRGDACVMASNLLKIALTK